MAGVQFFPVGDSARLQEHVDEHVQEAGRLLLDGDPVHTPLVDDREDKVAKDGLEENHTGEKVAPNIDR